MAELNYPESGIPAIKGIPDNLHMALKLAAIHRGIPLKTYIIEVLQNAVSETIAKPNATK